MMVLKHQEKNHHLVYHPYHHLQDYMLLVLVLEIEQRDEEWVDFKLQTLRKLIARYRYLGTPRVKAAMDILSAVLRKGLVFKTLGERPELALQNSLQEIPEFEWNPEQAEVLRLDQWMLSKRK